MPARKNRRKAATPVSSTQMRTTAVTATRSLSGLDLATLILDPDRQVPVVVVSREPDKPTLDADELARELGQEARVIVTVSGPATRQLAELLPARTEVYGNAVRIYPASEDWHRDLSRAPLFFVQNEQRIKAVLRAVTEFVDGLSVPERYEQNHNPVTPKPVTGVVVGFDADGSRAVIELPDGRYVSIRQEALLPGVPLHWLLNKGQHVSGEACDDGELRCQVPARISSVQRVYPGGSTVLALVRGISAAHATLELFPGATFQMKLQDVTSNELDTLEDLLTVGEVVVVRLDYSHGPVRLSMIDVDDEESVLTPPALIPDGPPWLELGRNLPAAGGTAPASAHLPDDAQAAVGMDSETDPAEAPGRTALNALKLSLDAARAEADKLRAEILYGGKPESLPLPREEDVDSQNKLIAELELQLDESDQMLRQNQRRLVEANRKNVELKARLRAARRQPEERSDDRQFENPEDEVRFRIYLTWVERVPATEKADYPLPEMYRVGPEFATSFQGLSPDKRHKALRAVVDLLTGRADQAASRGAHHLRAKLSGNAPAVTRNNGKDVCWRLAIEQSVEAARRLHYWKCADGSIELSRVVVHDDYNP